MKKWLQSKMLVGTQNQQCREEWLQQILKKVPQGSRILDAGAGELAYKKFCTHLEYVAQDFGQYDGIGNNDGLQTGAWDNSKIDIVSDIVQIPEPDKSFDAIMCIEVFEHLPNPVAAIVEFSRLVKDDGFLILSAPFCSLTHFAPYHFYTGFNRYFYEKHLTENQFEIVELAYNGNYFEYVAQELRRVKSCAKRYSNMRLSVLDKVFIYFILRKLEKLSQKGKSSEELLSFGIHILARKRADR